MSVRLYVEGGGDRNKALQAECRRGFSEFFRKSGLEGRMPRIVACGGRRQAYDSFRVEQESEEDALQILLVDSEEAISAGGPWEHVRRRDGDQWARPADASEDQLHLMVQAMEAWFYADRDALASFYGSGFRPGPLSSRAKVEEIPKGDLFSGLQRATRECGRKGEYSKGGHSFQLLALIDPARVQGASPYARRLIETLLRLC